ncbi:unnamed protein product [Thelazia callipaeda]|uniref:SAYSvFN domain-containing protein n=1 Tax=Thelazia callipaeda TaxID=103827 RepID=A0A0N5CSM2_THECL|nr:unnamed protein product [Thelazia callipaeda]
MKCVEDRLLEYRRRNSSIDVKKTLQVVVVDEASKQQSRISCVSFALFCIFNKLVNLLSVPFELWSLVYGRWPHICMVSAIFSWFVAQIFFIYIEFGLVFFIFSLFVILFINMEKRKPGDLSAYSVFNPRCERLLGTMTAEHFERDLLKKPVYN